MADRYSFTRTSAERIASAVRAVERTRKQGSPLEFRTPESGVRPVFRIGTFSTSWQKGATNVVTLRGGGTVTAVNLFANVSQGGNCAIARDGTAWYLIAAEC